MEYVGGLFYRDDKPIIMVFDKYGYPVRCPKKKRKAKNILKKTKLLIETNISNLPNYFFLDLWKEKWADLQIHPSMHQFTLD